jgi:hypothetical protein
MTVDDYEFDDDPLRIDRAVVIEFLTTEAYWARWRGGREIERQLEPRGAWSERTSGRLAAWLASPGLCRTASRSRIWPTCSSYEHTVDGVSAIAWWGP